MKAKRPSPPSVTLKDISEATGLSIPSVSRILGNPETAALYNEKTQARVREAALQMGYRPNRLAKAVRNNETRQVGLIVHQDKRNLAPTYHSADFLAGITERLEAAGYTGVIVPMELLEKNEEEVRQVFSEKFADAFIMLAFLQPNLLSRFEEIVREPTVWCDANVRKDRLCVYRNEVKAGELAGRNLRLRHGKALLLDRIRVASVNAAYREERRKGAFKALKERGAEIEILGRDPETDDWHGELLDFLRQGYDLVAQEYTAALQALNAGLTGGLVAGRDFNLVCSDDINLFARFLSQISRSSFDRVDAGRIAADMALEAIAGGNPADAACVVPRWLEGNTNRAG